jgi:G6PDH family F420-dependent oxidoreductase
MEIQLDLGENWYEPRGFVEALVYAEELGYRTAWFGDHFMPWFHSGNKSQFAWSTLGVALERTQKIKTGPLVTPPIGARYHPAIVAQASATLDNLFPGRFLLGVGTGEALNERPFWNGNWPPWSERMERLVEGIQLIRRLWESTRPFSFKGKYFGADFYQLYTKPKTKIPIYFAALGKKAAHFAGMYADNLVTLSPRNNMEKLKKEILPSYEQGLSVANKRRGSIVVHIAFSMTSPSEMKRKDWRKLGWIRKDSWSISDPVAVEKEGKKVTTEELKEKIHFVKNWGDLIKIIEDYEEVGATAVVLISEANKERIGEFAKNVLEVF